MKKNCFQSLPQETTIEIISRLPINAIARCKCVCKAWRELIDGSEFTTSHRSKSTDSGLAYIEDMTSSKPYKVCAFDGAGFSTRAVSGFGFPRDDSYNELIVHSSADGLLLLLDEGMLSITLLVCNPITRESTEIPPIRPNLPIYWVSILGFGASRVSRQYKVVGIYEEDFDYDVFGPRSECHVYDLGLGLWRRSREDWSKLYSYNGEGKYLNGNLHFLVSEDGLKVVSCFDLETERFTTSFPVPRGYGSCEESLRALDGRLCLFDHSSKDGFCIWFMNKYGDGSSWVKEYAFKTRCDCIGKLLFPIKVFEESGDILIGVKRGTELFVYSNITKTLRNYGVLRLHMRYPEFVVFTPSFLSLRTMGVQDCDVESVCY